MNKRQKEVLEVCLEDEKEVLGQLKANYTDALADIKLKIKNLQSNPLTQSKIYQIEYQQSLEKQISGILDILNGNNFATISGYLEKSYSRGFIGNMYDLQGQGVPLTIPIDENQVVKCVSRTADGYKLSDKLGGNTEKLKKQVKAHIQRGIAAEKPYTEIARSISDEGEADINRSMRIVRTEGGRIQNAARLDAMNGAAKRGADVVKMWDSTLDGKTRSTHRELDGQIKELDEPFEVAGKKAPAPCNFGIAAEDCNCRCCVLQRARWAVDNPEFQKYKMNNENGKIIECKDYKEFEEKYLKAVEKSDESDTIRAKSNKEPTENTSKPSTKKVENTAEAVVDYSSVGSRAFSEEAKQQMLRDERIISGNNYETAILYKADGTKLKLKKGTKDSVDFTKKEISEMKGGTLTHNHPNGTVFSPEDINMLEKGKLAEIRACNGRGAYVMRNNSKWHPDISDNDAITKKYWECMNEASKKYTALAAQEGKSPMYYLRQMDEDGLKLFAKRYGLEFSWEDKL